MFSWNNGKIIHSSVFTFLFWQLMFLKILFWDFPLNQMLQAWVAKGSPPWTGEKATKISANNWVKTVSTEIHMNFGPGHSSLGHSLMNQRIQGIGDFHFFLTHIHPGRRQIERKKKSSFLSSEPVVLPFLLYAHKIHIFYFLSTVFSYKERCNEGPLWMGLPWRICSR